jgi:DNA (cytosine-5)-methyltransferase 1
MGLPEGFVTDLGLPYSAQQRILGNGVVPQQARAALGQLVAMAVDVLTGDEERRLMA